MKKILTAKGRLIFGLICCLLYAESQALILIVYAKDGSKPTRKEFCTEATLLLEKKKTGELATYSDTRFGYVFEEKSSTLSASFSLPPKTSAYVWSDGPVKFNSGFKPSGSMIFESSTTTPKNLNNPNIQDASSFSLRSSLDGQILHLNYTLPNPSPIYLEAFSIRGKLLGKWNWNESESGFYTRDVGIQGLSGNTVLYLRWKSGKTQLIQKVINRRKKAL